MMWNGPSGSNMRRRPRPTIPGAASGTKWLGVIIPAAIAWKTAATLLQHGSVRRGYLGVAGQPVRVNDRPALLIVDVKPESPADRAGLRVADVILMFDEQPVESPEDLLELLAGDRVGKEVAIRVQRGDSVTGLRVTIADRTDRE